MRVNVDDLHDHIHRDPMECTSIGWTLASVLDSRLWERREQARKAYLHAYTAFLWHRAVWRRTMNATTRAAYWQADRTCTVALQRHNDMDGWLFSRLMSQGFDVDLLPQGRDECPLCRGEIIEDYGCACTNVDLAREIG